MSLYSGSRQSFMSDDASSYITESSYPSSVASSRYSSATSKAPSRYSTGQDSNADVYPTSPAAPDRLAKARVLYLGTAATEPSLKGQGLALVARPVTERLPDDLKEVQAIDAWLFVLDNGFQIGYVTDEKFLVWIPHQNVHMVAAVKRLSVGQPGVFVPIDSPEAEQAHSPPIFTLVTQRSTGLMECHSFICTSDTAAMSLVKAATFAHNHKNAWTKFPPSREVLLTNVQEAHDDLDDDDDRFSVHDVERSGPSEYSFQTQSTLAAPLEETGTQVDIPTAAPMDTVPEQRRHFQYRVKDNRGHTDRSYSDRSYSDRSYSDRSYSDRSDYRSRTSGFRSSGDYRSHGRSGRGDRADRGDRWRRDFDVEVVRPVGAVGPGPQQLAPWAVPPRNNMVQPNYHPVPLHTPAPMVVYGGSAAPPYSTYDSRSRGYSGYRR